MSEKVYSPSHVATHKSLVHSLEDHNYWVARNKRCPYCLGGSKPVAKCLIDVDGM